MIVVSQDKIHCTVLAPRGFRGKTEFRMDLGYNGYNGNTANVRLRKDLGYSGYSGNRSNVGLRKFV